MNIPVETKPALWGFVGGAAAIAIAGFSWGGWTTAGKAEAAAAIRSDDAVVVALAPMCVDKFRSTPDAPVQLVALKKADSWAQGEFIEKGGWATLPGAQPSGRVSAVAKACAALLVAA